MVWWLPSATMLLDAEMVDSILDSTPSNAHNISSA